MTDLFSTFKMTVDRSTLEAYSECPMQARLSADSKGVIGIAATIGEEGHRAISRVVTWYLDVWADCSKRDVAGRLELELQHARPDVQPQVIDAFRPMVWPFAAMLIELTGDHILRYDGGEGERSGQLACECGEFLLTSEDDLLQATASKQVLRSHDWKGGWGFYDIDDVAKALQFQKRAWLTLNNYPECDVLEVAVWNARKGQRLPYVQFPRSRLPQYEARIKSYLNILADYESAPLDKVPCWASTEKCRICDVAARCPAVDRPLPADDGELLRKRIAVNAHLGAIDAELQARVTRRGTPIMTPDGDEYGKFGAAKPTMTWKVKPGKGAADAAQND